MPALRGLKAFHDCNEVTLNQIHNLTKQILVGSRVRADSGSGAEANSGAEADQDPGLLFSSNNLKILVHTKILLL
jgi:hypothetical protein